MSISIGTNPTQELVSDLKASMSNADLAASFECLIALFLQATGNIRLEHSQGKSASSLSRYLNHYQWSTKSMWGEIRRLQLEQLLGCKMRGRPWLRVMVDLTSIEKRGEFKDIDEYMHTLNGVHGVHLAVVYIVIGKERIPWSIRLWQGKGAVSPADLALKQLKQLPKGLSQHHRIMVLGDGGYGSIAFVQGVKSLGWQAVVSMASDRKLEDGRHLRDIRHTQEVRPKGLGFAVWATRFKLKGIKGQADQWRYVISTRELTGRMIKRWGKRRWAIEGFFKTIKHRFGLHCFGQSTKLGVYRWFLFCLFAYMLAYQAHNQQAAPQDWPDWQEVSKLAITLFLPQFLAFYLLYEIDRLNSISRHLGLSISLSAS